MSRTFKVLLFGLLVLGCIEHLSHGQSNPPRIPETETIQERESTPGVSPMRSAQIRRVHSPLGVWTAPDIIPPRYGGAEEQSFWRQGNQGRREFGGVNRWELRSRQPLEGATTYGVNTCATCFDGGVPVQRIEQRIAAAIEVPQGAALPQGAQTFTFGPPHAARTFLIGPQTHPSRPADSAIVRVPMTFYRVGFEECPTCGTRTDPRLFLTDMQGQYASARARDNVMQLDLHRFLRQDSSPVCAGCTNFTLGRGSARNEQGGWWEAYHGQCASCGGQATVTRGPGGERAFRVGRPLASGFHGDVPTPGTSDAPAMHDAVIQAESDHTHNLIQRDVRRDQAQRGDR